MAELKELFPIDTTDRLGRSYCYLYNNHRLDRVRLVENVHESLPVSRIDRLGRSIIIVIYE